MGDKIEEALNLFNSMGYDSDQEIIITVLVIIIFSPTEKVGGKFRILKNKENGRYRVLFRDNHERVLLNHYVNPDIQFNYKEGEQKGVKYHVIEYETYDFAQLTENQEPKKVKITVTSPPSKPEYTENLYTALLDAQKKNAALLERTWPVIIPRLLSTARRMSLSPQQFSEDFLNSSFNLNDHVEYCSHYKNESCFLVATYFINQNGNYQKRDLISAISSLFEKCASTNQHCADILVQLEYFHTPNITIFDALKIYDHYQSDSIFCHLLHIALHHAVDFVDYENYLLINQITRLAFLEYTADPLRAKINTEYIDSIIKEDNILKIERIMDKFLISSKTWQEIPDSDNYLLKYSRVRQLFLNDLNKKADSAGSIGQTMKILLENDNPNTTNYTYILNNCYKKQSKFNTQLSAIIQLFGLANGTRASDAVPLIKSLSDDGDIFFSELAIFLNLFFEDLKMPEIGLEYDYFEDGLIEAFIDDVSLRNSSISKKYVDLRKFLDVSPVFSDIIVAEEMMREGHWDSAQFLLERMSLMGNCHALKLLKYITSKRKMDINQVLKLEKLFCNSTTENKFYKNKHLDPKILSIIDKYPISSYYYSHNSEPPEVARAYYSYAVEKNNESLFKRINRRISLEIDILIQQTYEGMFIEMSFSTKFVIVITFIFLIIKVANNVKTQLFDNNQRPVFLNVNSPVPKPARVN